MNEVICHGIPDATVLQDGDLINIDVTVNANRVIELCAAATICSYLIRLSICGTVPTLFCFYAEFGHCAVAKIQYPCFRLPRREYFFSAYSVFCSRAHTACIYFRARTQVYYQGYHGDCSETFAAGQVDDEGIRLVQVTVY